MASPEELARMRAEVERLRRQAGRKASRLRRSKGVEMSGSPEYPVRDRASHQKYNMRQLNSYAERLRGFINRRTQYVPDKEGNPIPRHKMNQYKQYERQYNQSVESDRNQAKDLLLPSGETIGERLNKMTPTHRVMGGGAAGGTEDRSRHLESRNFKNERALEAMAEKIRERTRPGYQQWLNSRHRIAAEKMLTTLGDNELRDSVRNLSDKQFHLLWTYTNFAEAAALNYENKLKLLHSSGSVTKTSYEETLLTDSLAEARALVQSAKEWKV